MRASRLLAILILLQARRRLTAAALAEEFEVSERTIYRDIDALSAAGVPVYGDRGPGGGFALLDGWRTRLTGMLGDEAAALALAGVPSAAEAAGLGVALRDAFAKLLVALPGDDSARAGQAAAGFHIDPADWYRAGEPVPQLPLLARAVLDQRPVLFGYTSWTRERSWRAEPHGLVLKAGEWYLAAWAEGRMTTFRVTAIADLELVEGHFEPQPGFDLARWWEESQLRFEAGLFSTQARLRASHEGMARLARLSQRGRDAVAGADPPGAGGWAELTMLVEDSDHGARELLSLGPEVEVLAPASLRRRIGDLAARLAQLHDRNSGDR